METKKITLEELLFNDEPITINRKLAKCLGLKESLFIQRIISLCKIEEKLDMKKEQTQEFGFFECRYWTKRSLKEWHEDFTFLSKETIKRTLKKLRNKCVILTSFLDNDHFDRTLWYSIDYDVLNLLLENGGAYNE